VTAILVLALPPITQAEEIEVLRGQLLAESRDGFLGLFVGMEDLVNHTQTHRVDVALDGTFQFRRVPTGEYLLRITDMQGETVSQHHVTVYQHMVELEVRMPPSVRITSAPGTVSLTQLRHPPAKKAVQAFSAASRLSSSGKYDEAAAELEKAIRISPEFASAYTNLAVQHIRLRRYQEAAAASERALQIAGPDPLNLCNLAFAQFQLRRLDEAAASARAALRLDSSYTQADLVLGAVLANDPATRDQAIQHLERAAEKFPSARVNLERLRAGAR
jgi:tetratricopeptide (TPR) repeat protein